MAIVSNNSVERWGMLELIFDGPKDGNPFRDVMFKARFCCKGFEIETAGFYDGNGIYKIRFMPQMTGEWTYKTDSNCEVLDNIEGVFSCTEPSESNHGQVRVSDRYHFAYDDGTQYYPFGTTCYAWTHQTNELEEETLKTLAKSPFNKIRMCVFPKHYNYNHNEPVFYPFKGNLEDGWDFEEFNPQYFKHLEKRIQDLMDLDIEADIILFHPYDRWGFSKMSAEVDDRYLHYIVSRLSAYRNIWWSFANEFDLMKEKSLADWERFAQIVVDNDPYQHLRSIHQCYSMYDHTRPWVTHCSIQRIDGYKTSEYVNEWCDRYRKPVVVDECEYEGNLHHGWGNITGEEMTRRFWEGTLRGGYVGHGETYVHPDDIIWWSKGGTLHGSSPQRIDFLRKIVDESPVKYFNHIPVAWDVVCGGLKGEYYLFYFGFRQPSFRIFFMPEDLELKVEIIDTWNMTIEEVSGRYQGEFRIELPSKPYIAVRMTCDKKE